MTLPNANPSTSNRPLSERQRRTVVRHLPLVGMTLRRHFRPGIRRGLDPRELFQEGCLALADAVLSHNRRRHGRFASYAMARIHFAVAAFMHERSHLVRVPYITQRRGQAFGCVPQGNVPSVVQFSERLEWLRRDPIRSRARPAAPEAGEPGEPSVGEMLRERLDMAVGRAMGELSDSARDRPETRAVLEKCLSERWLVPETEMKTPIRKLAKELRCSVGRITHCEGRFRRKVAERLEEDDAFQTLSRLAKTHPAGMDGRLNAGATAKLRECRERNRKHDPRRG